jgi:hypothetical protein
MIGSNKLSKPFPIRKFPKSRCNIEPRITAAGELNVKKALKNISEGELNLVWHPTKRRMVVSQALFQGIEDPVAWRLVWFDGEWGSQFLPAGAETWRNTTTHDLYPDSAEEYARAVHVTQVIARRFARSYAPIDGRGLWSDLAKAAQELKLV